MNDFQQTANESQLFIDELREVLSLPRIKTTTSVDDKLASAKVNLNTFVTDDQLDEVGRIAVENDMSFLIKRSGPGIVIEFKKR